MLRIPTLKPRIPTADTRMAPPPPKTADAELGSRDWKVMRLKVKERAKGMCQAKGCTKPGCYADHIVERRDGGAVFDMANLEWLCAPHHQIKTAQERARRAQT